MKGFVAQLTEAQIFGLPVGAVVGGAAIGGVGDALSGVIRGFAPQFPTWAVKGVAALAIINWGPRLVGKDIAQLGGLFLTYDAIQELFNIRGSISGIVGKFTGQLTNRVVATSNNPGNTSKEADYYARLGG